ncbi:MAG: hypothetical protein OEY97_12630 [Nitrospirota bacterium]|nr:hypothetical protein [Nitrospirota bacterium]
MNNTVTGSGGRLELRELYLYKKAHTAPVDEARPSDLQPLMIGIAVWMGVIGLLWLIG